MLTGILQSRHDVVHFSPFIVRVFHSWWFEVGHLLGIYSIHHGMKPIEPPRISSSTHAFIASFGAVLFSGFIQFGRCEVESYLSVLSELNY